MKPDIFYIKKAAKLALKAKGLTSPNPLVGASVVKNGKIIGEGSHKKAGGPHAEIFALREAGINAEGASLYVTLEPCRHFGRTPPCTDAIIKSRIKEVIIGVKDPNPINNGKAIAILKKAGIKVSVGFLEDELNKMNESFNKYITKKLPFVTVKAGQSLDGKIATRRGDSKWITSEKSRGLARKMRNFYDAIMVGANTVIKDDPLLNCAQGRDRFFKIIVDPELKVSLNSKIFSRMSKGKLIIASAESASEEKARLIQNRGASVIKFKAKNGRISLRQLLKELAKKEITSVFVEGGGELIGSLFDEGLVDKVMFFIAPKIIGGSGEVSSVKGTGVEKVNDAVRLRDVKLKKIGEDFLIEGYVNEPSTFNKF